VADRVHPAVKQVEAARAHPEGDRRAREAEREELAAGDDPALGGREAGDPSVHNRCLDRRFGPRQRS
jgi:hypothetical protein